MNGHLPPEAWPEGHWLTLREAADLTGYTRQRLGQLVRAGELPARRIGNRAYIVRREDVLARPRLRAPNGAPVKNATFALPDEAIDAIEAYRRRKRLRSRSVALRKLLDVAFAVEGLGAPRARL